jgi:AAHS family 4-hydroxybenzoate transporter-like MFS transporter
MTAALLPPGVPVRDLIDQNRVSAYQVMVLVLCFAVVLLDGFDTAAIGYIAPALRQEWHLATTQLAPAFGAGLFGLMIGSLCFGPIADRFGRKPVLLGSVLLFGVATLATAASDTLSTLVVLRLITGIGLGGAMPVCITLSAEYSPQRYRTLLVTLSWSGFTTGLALGGLVAGAILPTQGWRGVLLLGGVAPLLLLPVLALLMPESAQYLAQRSKGKAALRRIVRRITGRAGWESVNLVGDSAAGADTPRFPVKLLFSGGMVARTLLLWLTFFASLFVFYLLTSWLPTLMRDSGLAMADAARVGAMVPLGGTVGAIVLALLMDRTGPTRVLIVAYFCSAFAVAAIGFALKDAAWLMAAVFLVGFGIAGAQNGINLLAAQMYPTAARATGVSWALSAGRAGSIVGSMVGGYLMAAAGNPQAFFGIVAAPALLAGCALLILSRPNQAARIAPTQGHASTA